MSFLKLVLCLDKAKEEINSILPITLIHITTEPTYDFAKFCEKLHEIEKILGILNPPLAKCFCVCVIFLC